MKTVFSANQCRLYREDQVIVEGRKLEDGLYTLNIRALKASPSAMKISHPKSLSDWHRALRHATASRRLTTQESGKFTSSAMRQDTET